MQCTQMLITAGVKDAEIQITAPFKVSGTAALTGLMKAYETTSNKQIPEEVKSSQRRNGANSPAR